MIDPFVLKFNIMMVVDVHPIDINLLKKIITKGNLLQKYLNMIPLLNP